MYSDVKSCIVHNNNVSDTFASEIGVRQGEHLSPLLFSMYLNDLQEYLQNFDVNGIKSISDDIENELNLYLKLFLLLYADDTILLSETSTDLQLLLDKFCFYCTKWKLKININKTKVMVFSKCRIPDTLKFFINNEELEIVKSYKYLGILFSKSGSFLATRKHKRDQANKAMYCIIRKCGTNHLTIKCRLDMFDKAINPILLYGWEFWGL